VPAQIKMIANERIKTFTLRRFFGPSKFGKTYLQMWLAVIDGQARQEMLDEPASALLGVFELRHCLQRVLGSSRQCDLLVDTFKLLYGNGHIVLAET
jgi:hypothetical protein